MITGTLKALYPCNGWQEHNMLLPAFHGSMKDALDLLKIRHPGMECVVSNPGTEYWSWFEAGRVYYLYLEDRTLKKISVANLAKAEWENAQKVIEAAREEPPTL